MENLGDILKRLADNNNISGDSVGAAPESSGLEKLHPIRGLTGSGFTMAGSRIRTDGSSAACAICLWYSDRWVPALQRGGGAHTDLRPMPPPGSLRSIGFSCSSGIGVFPSIRPVVVP